jgi:hypothetical protein
MQKKTLKTVFNYAFSSHINFNYYRITYTLLKL